VFCHENGKAAKRLSGEALAYFLAYDWPGNIRELRNMVERLVIMAPRETIEPDDLPPPLRPKTLARHPRAWRAHCARRVTTSSARTSWPSCACMAST